MKKIFVILNIAIPMLFALVSCNDDDYFSVSPSKLLIFSNDTICLDTVFSTIPTPTYSFWVYNKSGDGIRCTKIRLASGNQTGFRVNVDGEYLSPTYGYQISDIEIRNKDSIMVFVELTSAENGKSEPQLLEDNLIFLLESGVEQRINLRAYTWDATLLKNITIKNDTTIASVDKPIVVYGGITVDSCATLYISAGTTLYFHSDAGMNIYGRLVSRGTAGQNVILRGDRTDKMFDYLPYDMVSGQWRGVRFYSSSYNNVIGYTDIHATFDGVVCDSSDISKSKLQIYNSTIHNCQGYGLKSVCSVIDVKNCQITNTLNDCVAIFGGSVSLTQCTLAQFYPFDSNRGSALRYTNGYDDKMLPLNQMDCINTIVTGYENDQIAGTNMDIDGSGTAFNYRFINSLLRTPEISDDENIINVIFENTDEDDAVTGEKHFRLVDLNRQRFDFHLNSDSPAINNGDINYSLPIDRDGIQRDEAPDIGCYEFVD